MAKHIYSRDCRILADILPAITGYSTVSHNHFASIADCAAYVEALPRSGYWYSDVCEDDAGTVEFCGGLTWRNALDMARDGWKDGADRAAALRDRVNASRPALTRIAQWDVAGALPNVPRYLAGNPLCMKRTATSETRKRPVLTLVANIGGSWTIGADCFVNRAAVIAAVVDAIETAGYSLHLIAANVAHKNDFAVEIATTIKEPGQHVDIAQVAYGLGHPGYFRRLGFAVKASSKVNRPIGTSLGSPRNYSDRSENCFILPSMNDCYSYFESEQLAATVGMESTVRELARQGCPAFRDHEAFNPNT